MNRVAFIRQIFLDFYIEPLLFVLLDCIENGLNEARIGFDLKMRR